jgi:two-component system, chemotaxis family, protein-glutamate methylesterase/glutaminase
MKKTVRIVVADDSPFTCRLLTTYFQAAPDLKVVGTAYDGARAIELVRELHPDVVTMDLQMPGTDGLQALETIMQEFPVPVVVVSGLSRRAAEITQQAIDQGAVDFIFKYSPGANLDPEGLRKEIVSKVRAAAQIKVVRSIRSFQQRQREERAFVELMPHGGEGSASPIFQGNVIVIGASTGGPVALRELLSKLPADFPDALVIVQHIPAGFTGALASQLERQSRLRVREAQAGDMIRGGQALVAPGGHHLLFRPDGRVELNQAMEICGHRPSIDVTMQSVAQVFGANTRGILLTGMGEDGVQGLIAIRAKGGKTFAQDEKSSIVYGMPKQAIKKGLVDYVASPTELSRLLSIGSARYQGK